MFRTYYQLTKPGIIYGNAITAIAGFFLAEKGHFNLLLFLEILIGLSLVIGSACVFNNVADEDIDKKMDRTKNRGVASGEIPKFNALIYGGVLVLIGSVLLNYSNTLTLAIALIGWFVYVLIYTPLKRVTVHDTLIGAIAGAVPPVVGYVAVTNKFDHAAILLFLILAFWQMPHFYAIAVYRLKDYAAASIPVLPIKKGMRATKIQIVLYIIAFAISCLLLKIYGVTGYSFAVISLILSLLWLFKALKGFSAGIDDTVWGKKVFLFSLITLTTLSLALALNVVLP
jgi:protoheme IX farnesyltransferase